MKKTYTVVADRLRGTLFGYRLINRKLGETVSYHLAGRQGEAEAERDRLNRAERKEVGR